MSSEAVDGVEYVAAVHGAAVGHPAPHGRANRRRPLHPPHQRALLPWLVAGPLRPKRRRRRRRRRGGVASGAGEESCGGDGERRPPVPEQQHQCITASQRRRPQYGRVGRLSRLTPSARVVAQLRSVEEPIISPSSQHNNIAHQPTRPSHTMSLVAPLAQSHWHQGAAPPPARP